jgi:Tfp pilus assembly protein PilF
MKGAQKLNRALALQTQGRLLDAKRIYEAILLKAPTDVDALHLLGLVFLELGDAVRAEALISKALDIKNDQPEFHCNYGLVMRSLGKITDSLKAYERAIRFKPDYPAAHVNRGVALQDMGRYDEALRSFNRAIALDPKVVAFSNRGILKRLMRRPDSAIEDFRRALALDPQHVESHWSLSLALLDQQQFMLGWQEYEWRLKNRDLNPKLLKTHASRWTPSVSSKRLLVYAEQGIGDQVFFSVAFSKSTALAEQVVLRCDDRLVGLFQRSFPALEVVSDRVPIDHLRFDHYLELGSVFWALESVGVLTHDVPKGGYLVSNSELSRELRRSLLGKKRRLCGVSWRSQNAPFSAEKSVNIIDCIAVLRDPETAYVSLQYGAVSGELRALYDHHEIQIIECESVDNYTNLDGHAALISACDHVISVSNSTAHLAGALGVMGAAAIPYARGIFFYWMAKSQGRSYWYPSLSLFDQESPGDWNSVFLKISRSFD